jgi:uncharacterized protein (TIGR02646 family)
MKRIIKSNPPIELKQWFHAQPIDNNEKLNCRYDNLPSDIRAIVKQRLLEDQGYICCYTGIRISEARSHIEHLKPQSVYFENYEDVDYNNLLAAHPGPNSGQCAYGAHPKADWYHEEHFISPLSPQCETAFKFNTKGELQSKSPDLAIKTTIDRLNLTDESLTELRKQAIETLLFEPEMSLRQAEILLEKIYDRNSKGQFRPFCFVLKQACEEYIRRSKQRKIRNKAIKSQASSNRSKE